MTSLKNRFKIGDSIEQLRYDEVIRKGEVVKGPFRVENIDHYYVKWSWEDVKHFGKAMMFKTAEEDLICDMVSPKYHYR